MSEEIQCIARDLVDKSVVLYVQCFPKTVKPTYMDQNVWLKEGPVQLQIVRSPNHPKYKIFR